MELRIVSACWHTCMNRHTSFHGDTLRSVILSLVLASRISYIHSLHHYMHGKRARKKERGQIVERCESLPRWKWVRNPRCDREQGSEMEYAMLVRDLAVCPLLSLILLRA